MRKLKSNEMLADTALALVFVDILFLDVILNQVLMHLSGHVISLI
jgi:hypothetical protein